jgi:S1-C subfamily serine protease
VDSGASCSVRIGGYRRAFEAEVIGRDEVWDVALLKITPPHPLRPVSLVNAAPEIGDTAFVVGNPYGIGKTVTRGIISALERRGVSRAKNAPANFIQTDSPIHPGNSGGPLVDVKGRVIGINSQVDDHTTAGAGLGYAIPILSVVKSCQTLWLNTHKQEGLFGMDLEDLSADQRQNLKIPEGVDGVLVTRVVKNLPADQAGVKADDLIVAVDEAKVADEPACHFKLASTEPGDAVRLKLFRQGKYVEVKPVAIAKSEE